MVVAWPIMLLTYAAGVLWLFLALWVMLISLAVLGLPWLVQATLVDRNKHAAWGLACIACFVLGCLAYRHYGR